MTEDMKRAMPILALLVLVGVVMSLTSSCGSEPTEYEKYADLRREVITQYCQDPGKQRCFEEVLEGEISQCMEEAADKIERSGLSEEAILRFCRTSIWKQETWPGGH